MDRLKHCGNYHVIRKTWRVDVSWVDSWLARLLLWHSSLHYRRWYKERGGARPSKAERGAAGDHCSECDSADKNDNWSQTTAVVRAADNRENIPLCARRVFIGRPECGNQMTLAWEWWEKSCRKQEWESISTLIPGIRRVKEVPVVMETITLPPQRCGRLPALLRYALSYALTWATRHTLLSCKTSPWMTFLGDVPEAGGAV